MTEIILEKQINVKEKVEQDVKEPSKYKVIFMNDNETCLLYTSPSPRDAHESRMPSSA